MFKFKNIKRSLYILSIALAVSTSFAPAQALAHTMPASITSSTYFAQSNPPAPPTDTPKFVPNDCQNGIQGKCGITKYLTIFINALSALVGIVVVIMIIIGGIQYAAASDDPAKLAAAKQRIANAILALIIFVFAFSFLQWLIPGGIF